MAWQLFFSRTVSVPLIYSAKLQPLVLGVLTLLLHFPGLIIESHVSEFIVALVWRQSQFSSNALVFLYH